MQNEASKTRTLNIAFVVTPDLLKRLAVILGETSDFLEYTVKYSDGTSVHYDKIEDVIGQSNSDRRSIVSLIAGTAGEGVRVGIHQPEERRFPVSGIHNQWRAARCDLFCGPTRRLGCSRAPVVLAIHFQSLFDRLLCHFFPFGSRGVHLAYLRMGACFGTE